MNGFYLSNMKVILSHSGKQHAYQVAKALNSLGYLNKFYTSSYIKSKKLQDYLTQNKNTYWTRRFLHGLEGDIVDSNWKYEIKEVLLRHVFGKNKITHGAVLQRDIAFDRKVAKKLKYHKANAFWGFQGSCLESIKNANCIGIQTFCEQTAPYYQSVKDIIYEEGKLSPEWLDSLEDLSFPKDYEKRLYEEPIISNKVIVASEFSKSTLLKSGINEDKIVKLNLGCEIDSIPYRIESPNFGNQPLKLLYVGRISQSKGLKYLLEAIKKFKSSDVTLDIIGNLIGSGRALSTYKGYYKHLPAVSQEILFKKYQDYDALVLPTLYDGFGLVMIEAMAAGLPVIASENSFGPELIMDNKNGWVVPVRASDSIANCIEKLKNLSQEGYQNMRVRARETAEKMNWNIYTGRLSKIFE